MLVLYSCGRFIANASGLLALPLLLAAAALPAARSTPADVLFGAVLYAAGYTFGRIVRRRSLTSARAFTLVAGLAAKDPVMLAGRQVAAERVRFATEAMAVIGTAIGAMGEAAAGAERSLSPHDLSLINATGAEAVARLRSLLVELRGGGAAAAGEPPARQHPPSLRRTMLWLLPSGVAAALLGAEAQLPGPDMAPLQTSTAVAVAAALLFRRRSTGAMCALMAVVLGLCALLGAPLPQGLALACCCVVAVWCAVVDGHRGAVMGAFILAAVLLGILAVHEPQNMAINVGLLGMTALAAHAWRAHGRAEQASLLEMAELQLRFTSSFDAVLMAGRLESARAIHDVASHAVGAMVMQANAASAQRMNDPGAARVSLGLVSRVSREATTELAALMAGSLGLPDDSGPASLQDIIEQVSAAGTPVSLVRADPVDPAHAGIAYKIIREALFNAVRHAHGSPVRISITTTPRQSTVSVISGPAPAGHRTPAVPNTPGAGFGLQGLAELAASAGGFLRAGEVGREPNGGCPASGFEVAAVLPAVPLKEQP